MGQKLLKRYEHGDRMNHWFIALMFVLAGLSGLAFFHPSLFFLTNLFGGGQWTRILHPFMGVLMVAGFLVLFLKLWRENVVNDADREWKKHMGDMLRGNKAAMPPVGKYNYGQKMVFWVHVLAPVVRTAVSDSRHAHCRVAAFDRCSGSGGVGDHACVCRDLGQGHGTGDDARHGD
jgi:formate dehydrogenase subunit gamma